MPARNPVHEEFDRFKRRWSSFLSGVNSDLKAYGFTINTTDMELRKAIEEVFRRRGYTGKLSSAVMVGIMNSAEIGGANLLPSAEAWWLRHHFRGDEFTLAQRIYKSGLETRRIIYSTISDQLGASASWWRTAQKVYKTGLPSGEIPKYLDELLESSRRAVADPGERLAYQRLLRKTQRQIERLAANKAPTTRLKKAYQNLLNKTASGTEDQIQKAIERAVKAKSKYISDRLARTEFAKAYGNASWYNMAQDKDVVAYRSALSTRHKIIDICDLHAGADQYGMGPGIFPKDQGPPYPYHPHCMCKIVPVYRGEVTVSNTQKKDGVKTYIDDHPGKAKKIMGAGDYKEYKKSKSNPERYINNWKNYEQHRTQLRRRDIED